MNERLTAVAYLAITRDIAVIAFVIAWIIDNY